MNPQSAALLNGVLRIAAFVCLVTGFGLRFGAWAAFVAAGALLALQAAPPRPRGEPK